MVLSVSQVKNLKLARKYKWDISFPSFGNNVFTAISFDDNLFNIQLGSLDIQVLSIPYIEKVSTSFETELTLIELDSFEIYFWLHDWYKKYDKGNKRVALLGSEGVIEDMVVSYYSANNSIKVTKIYNVVLNGSPTASFGVDNDILNITLPLKIIGKSGV